MEKKRRGGRWQKENQVYSLGGKLFGSGKSREIKKKDSAAANAETSGKTRKETDYQIHSAKIPQSILPAEKATNPPKIFRRRTGFIFLKQSEAAIPPKIPPGI